MWATSFEVVWDDRLFVPGSQILSDINVWNWGWFGDLFSKRWLDSTVVCADADQKGNQSDTCQNKWLVHASKVRFYLLLQKENSWIKGKSQQKYNIRTEIEYHY